MTRRILYSAMAAALCAAAATAILYLLTGGTP